VPATAAAEEQTGTERIHSTLATVAPGRPELTSTSPAKTGRPDAERGSNAPVRQTGGLPL
jgi:hypothetical protein